MKKTRTSITSRRRAVNLWLALESGELEVTDLTTWELAAVIKMLEGVLNGHN